MTLGQFATAAGAPPRWVQNARAQLRLRGKYSEESAKRLGLARTLCDATGMPLQRAYPLARKALAEWPEVRQWVHAAADGVAGININTERYLATFAVRLSLAQSAYTERARGPRTPNPRNAIAAAIKHGVDITLLEANLKLAPTERLCQMDEMSEFLRSARVSGG
jgi:hypothetical protein